MGSCTSAYHQIMDMTDAIETKLIDPPRFPLRSYTDDVQTMVTSIRERGLINPIVVRPVGNRFEVVAGAMRFEAVKRLRWARVPCIVRELRDRDAFEIALAENIQRKSMDPLEEAASFRRYIDHYGRGSEMQLAKKIGKSQEYISHRLSLLHLPRSVKDRIMRHHINASIAQEIAAISDKNLQIAISKQVVKQRLTIRGLRALTRQIKKAEGSMAPQVEPLGHEEPDFMARPRRETARRITERRDLQRAILLYKLTMSRLATLTGSLSEESEIRDILLEHKMVVQNLANSLIRLRMKVERQMGRVAAIPL